MKRETCLCSFVDRVQNGSRSRNHLGSVLRALLRLSGHPSANLFGAIRQTKQSALLGVQRSIVLLWIAQYFQKFCSRGLFKKIKEERGWRTLVVDFLLNMGRMNSEKAVCMVKGFCRISGQRICQPMGQVAKYVRQLVCIRPRRISARSCGKHCWTSTAQIGQRTFPVPRMF